MQPVHRLAKVLVLEHFVETGLEQLDKLVTSTHFDSAQTAHLKFLRELALVADDADLAQTLYEVGGQRGDVDGGEHVSGEAEVQVLDHFGLVDLVLVEELKAELAEDALSLLQLAQPLLRQIARVEQPQDESALHALALLLLD